MSIRLRLNLIVLLSITITILVMSLILGRYSINSMHDTISHQLEQDLTAKRNLVGDEVNLYFSTINKQIVNMSQNIMFKEAAAEFTAAFNAYPAQRSPIDANIKRSVEDYYHHDFTNVYQQQNVDPLSSEKLYQPLDDTSYLLQYDFISNNPYPLGEKDSLAILKNNSDYARFHKRYHSSVRQFLSEFGFYDIFIADAVSGDIVYSVFKELDFSTSLYDGPYADTGIGRAFQTAMTLKVGETYITDFDRYLPSYHNPASFISAPIIVDGETIAVLIFQMPIDKINTIMTQDHQWQEKGFGQSGEVYLVGQDQTLRNESRFFLEDKSDYLNAIKRQSNDEAERIKVKNSSISIQTVTSDTAKQALAGKRGFSIVEDYRGVSVLSAYAPIKINNLEWAILAEIDYAEAFNDVDTLATAFITFTLILAVIILAIALVCALVLTNYLIKPLTQIDERFAELSKGEGDLTQQMSLFGIREIDNIVNSFNPFLNQIRQLIDQIKTMAETVASSSLELSATTEQAQITCKQQLSETDEVSSSMQQFNQAIAEVADHSTKASEQTSDAQSSTSENTERANQAKDNIQQLVSEVTSSAQVINNLKSEVSNINEVLNVINGIADQTNLLALNAAIEAARAGEHGRGFAVVADEVRTLASLTQKSTVEIQSKILQLTDAANASVDSMDRASASAQSGIDLVETVSNTLTQLNSTITVLSGVNQSVASASEQQKYTCDHINGNIAKLRNHSLEVDAANDNITQASVSLSELAVNMLDMVKRFKT